MIYFLLIIITSAIAFAFWRYRNAQLHKELLAGTLSPEEWQIIFKAVPLYKKIPENLRAQVEGKINLFLHEVEFIGCNGVEVTEEMELSIAAQACLMIANRDMWFQNLQTILIYPDAFKSKQKTRHGYVETEQEIVRIGESWARGPVILSWAHSKKGAFIENDGHNVVLHEFAHQLDDLTGYTDAAPILKHGHEYSDWNRVLKAAYERLVLDVSHGRRTEIDPYGAQSPVEFFAVVVELFFEKPTTLKREEPEVYAQLAQFFAMDTVGWG